MPVPVSVISRSCETTSVVVRRRDPSPPPSPVAMPPPLTTPHTSTTMRVREPHVNTTTTSFRAGDVSSDIARESAIVSRRESCYSPELSSGE